VKDLCKGDKIATSCDKVGATVKCVVRTETYGGKTAFCQLKGGLLITPGHPVKLNGIKNEWIYPRDVTEKKIVNCDAFYNLVVDQHHIAIINDI